MKTAINALLVIVMAAAPAFAQSGPAGKAQQADPAGKAKSKTADYMPLKVGTKWNYQIDRGESQKLLITQQVAAQDDGDGKPVARLETTVNGQKSPITEHWMTNEKGVFRVKQNNLDFTPPLCLLKYPLKAGQTWESKTTILGKQQDVVCRQGAEEDIEVPAGKYRAIPCTMQVSQGPVKFVTTYWFVENVGYVKQKFEVNGKPVLQELTKYEPAN